MNPSYLRIKLPKSIAMGRLQSWIGKPELDAPKEMDSFEYIDAACDDDGNWRGIAVFVHQSEDWTIFQDVTGYLASITATKWTELAGQDELIFTGYNDSVPYGQLIAISDGIVQREFLDDQQDPSDNVDKGRLPFEQESPIESWVDVAGFVDDDELGCEPDTGELWLFDNAT